MKFATCILENSESEMNFIVANQKELCGVAEFHVNGKGDCLHLNEDLIGLNRKIFFRKRRNAKFQQ